jgi:hypothetical protein
MSSLTATWQRGQRAECSCQPYFAVGSTNPNTAPRPGETIKTTLANGDDENYNVVSNGGEISSPTVGAGQTGSFTWTAPATAGTFVAKRLFHPTMEIAFTVA